MDKQIVKITESDLHKIVKESVNKVLTELDWRTYANAAKKRDAQIQQLGRDATDKGGNRLTHLRNNLDYAGYVRYQSPDILFVCSSTQTDALSNTN